MSVTTLEATAPELTAADRCDRCSAQAYVATQLPSGHDLLWCGHHYNDNEPALLAQGATIVHDRRKVLAA